MALSDLDIVLRLFLAMIAGGLLGMEREVSNRPAGLKTHILVSVGSTLITLVSIYMYTLVNSGDPGRIAAQIVSGIGFLGAGTIIIRGYDIKGLTTAASLWVNAGIGMAIGAGFYLGALIATLLAVLSLLILRELETKELGKKKTELIVYTAKREGVFEQITDILHKYSVHVYQVRIEQEEREKQKRVVFLFEVKIPISFKFEAFTVSLNEIKAIEKAVYDGKVIIR